MNSQTLKYFDGDTLATEAWLKKYALDGENTPDDMHKRLSLEYAKIEKEFIDDDEYFNKKIETLSQYGEMRFKNIYNILKLKGLNEYSQIKMLQDEIFYPLFKDFKYIIPGGSIMANLGKDIPTSLSNCFVIGQPEDSIDSIFNYAKDAAQLYKRRGGVGIDISQLRPKQANVNNASKTSTGSVSFMDLYSQVTNLIGQEGRRGALMISMDINHPDILDFITIKQDLTKVTGANISVKTNAEFMKAVENDEDYLLRFPCDWKINKETFFTPNTGKLMTDGNGHYWKKVKAKQIWDTLIECAHKSAEPGILFWDNNLNQDPAAVYNEYTPISTNPCFHPDTLIETVEGRKRIADITEPTYVYSMDKNEKLCIKKASAAFKTKLDTEVLEIKLRCGSSLKVTPNHKVYVHNKGWVEAHMLEVGDRIVHLLRVRRGAAYVGIKLTTEGNRDYRMEHRLVYESIFGETDKDIHHIDANTFNNSINNLEALSHSEHAKLTALEQNPQNHQVKDNLGRFVSSSESKKGAKNIINLPEELATGFKSKWDNAVMSIEWADKVDVYDIQVEDTHCLIANNMVAHNCGEIPLQSKDSCRLHAVNLYSLVRNPFTKTAFLDIDLAYSVFYEQVIIADNLVELELKAIDKILNKINPEWLTDLNDMPSTWLDKQTDEFKLWYEIRQTGSNSRRIGNGFTALGDMFAALNIKYGDVKSKQGFADLMLIKLRAEIDATVDLAILRGTFKGYDFNKEYEIIPKQESIIGYNKFYQHILNVYPEGVKRMIRYGRRNVSFSTIAPTGTISLMTQTTSGIEPLFSPYYKRRMKVSTKEESTYIDVDGQMFKEFIVIHPKLKIYAQIAKNIDITKEYNEEFWKEIYENSPYYNSCANSIKWEDRLEIQRIAQKKITHSISSTLNLPNDVTIEEVNEIYKTAYIIGLKGITIYRDGSRGGILVNTDSSENSKFTINKAPKRPKTLDANIYTLTNSGIKYLVVVGLFNNRPYEVFVKEIDKTVNINSKIGKVTKIKQGHYKLITNDYICENLNDDLAIEKKATALYVSMLLRHGADIKFIIKTAKKVDDNIASFTSAMNRVLSKYVEKEVLNDLCPECGSQIIREAGCEKCTNCTYSKCLMIYDINYKSV